MRVPGRYAHARHILVGSKAEAQAILNEITNARKPLKMFKKKPVHVSFWRSQTF